MTRDWTKERWRKQYVREPLQQRLWPVMARGLRELVNALAEDDGSLVRDVDDPIDALVRALGAYPHELELVHSAVELLLQDGHLATDARSIWIPGLPAAQSSGQPSTAKLEIAAPVAGGALPARTSTERVRQYRDRLRTGNAAGVSSAVPVRVSSAVSLLVSGVSASVPNRVSSSRGEGELDPSQSVNREKEKQKDHPPLKRARDRERVSLAVPSSVSPVASGNASRVSASVPPDRFMNEEEDGEELFEPRARKDLEEALGFPVHERAKLVLERPEMAASLRPEQWPEVVGVAAALAESTGLKEPCLGRYSDDEGVRAVVKLFAAGFPQTALEYVARVVPRQAWWSSGGKRLGLSSLSLEVVRRNLPGPDGKARILSPRVAKAIASLPEQPETADGVA